MGSKKVRSLFSDCLALEALWIKSPDIQLPSQRPFENVEYAVDVTSFQIGDLPATQIAPYGIFPFDDRTCFDLLAGELVIRATFNLEVLRRKYHQFGLSLELPKPNKEEIKAFSAALFKMNSYGVIPGKWNASSLL